MADQAPAPAAAVDAVNSWWIAGALLFAQSRALEAQEAVTMEAVPRLTGSMLQEMWLLNPFLSISKAPGLTAEVGSDLVSPRLGWIFRA